MIRQITEFILKVINVKKLVCGKLESDVGELAILYLVWANTLSDHVHMSRSVHLQ